MEGIGCLAQGGTGACVGLGWVAAAGPDLFPSLSSCSRFVQSVCQNLCRLPRTATSSWSRHSCCPCVVISIAAGPMAMAPLFTAPPAVPPLPLSMYAFPCARRVRRCTSSYVPCALRFGRPPLPGPMLPAAKLSISATSMSRRPSVCVAAAASVGVSRCVVAVVACPPSSFSCASAWLALVPTASLCACGVLSSWCVLLSPLRSSRSSCGCAFRLPSVRCASPPPASFVASGAATAVVGVFDAAAAVPECLGLGSSHSTSVELLQHFLQQR